MGYGSDAPRDGIAAKLAMFRSKRRTSKRGFMARYSALCRELDSWIEHYREIGEYTIPRRLRLLQTDRNRGGKLNAKIINTTPTEALDILSAGMMSGLSSPARPWFRLGTPYAELRNVDSVRLWLHSVEEVIRSVFSKSNVYNALPLAYRDLGAWGVAAMFVEDDADDVIRCYSYPIGSYVLQTSAREVVDTIYHQRGMTVGTIADKFGLANASETVRLAWQQNNLDLPVTVIHCIEPNETYDSSQLGKAGKRFRSVWFEYETGPSDGPPLSEGGGFHEFPAMCPRWDVNAGDIYGESPAMRALGDIKGLMQLERRKLSAIDKIVNPPMTAPTSLERKKRSQLAADVTFVDTTSGSQKFEPAFLIDSRIVYLKDEIQVHEQRIMRAFKADLFLMLSSMVRGQPITAREVEERHEEKMLQLGPVLERTHDELLAPLIRRTFEVLVRRSEPEWALGRPGMIPQPPIELQGMELRVEFISILAQAQKLLGTVATERLLGFVGANAALFPEAIDKVDIDSTIDDYAEMLGTNPDLVVTGDELAARREKRAQQQQMAAMAAAAKPAADGAQAASVLAGIDANQPSQLNTLVGALQPR